VFRGEASRPRRMSRGMGGRMVVAWEREGGRVRRRGDVVVGDGRRRVQGSF
jgi:hypothetical protein